MRKEPIIFLSIIFVLSSCYFKNFDFNMTISCSNRLLFFYFFYNFCSSC